MSSIDICNTQSMHFPSGEPQMYFEGPKTHLAGRHHIVMNKHCRQYIRFVVRLDPHIVFTWRREHSVQFPPKRSSVTQSLLLLSCIFHTATMRCYMSLVLLAWMVILLCEFNNAQVRYSEQKML